MLKIRDVFILLIFSLLLMSCNKQKTKSKPNILWIYSDDISLELGCYGNPDVQTPNLDNLAAGGVRYTKAYTTTPVCSSSRSSIITGMYPTSINCLEHRTINKLPLPGHVKPVTEYFKAAGYFCTNMDKSFEKWGKTDFNFQTENIFDAIDWKDRNKEQPFYAQVNIKYPHRSFVHDSENPIDFKTVKVPDCYPEHELIRADWAMYLESIQHLDKVVGNIVKRLKEEGLWENTIIFFFGDNGRPHLRDKQFLYEAGLNVPLIVYNPFKPGKNKVSHELVSMIDVTATSLDLAGIEVPEYMHGQIFMGKNAVKRDYVYGFRQRCGDAVDDIRSITDGKYKLIWNRMPELPYMQLSSYKRLQYPAFTVYKYLHSKGELSAPYNLFIAERRPEFELYDLSSDPMEFNNLVGKKEYERIESELKTQLKSALKEYEKGMIAEDEATIAKAKESSAKWFEGAMAKEGYTGEISDEEMMKYWEKTLLEK